MSFPTKSIVHTIVYIGIIMSLSISCKKRISQPKFIILPADERLENDEEFFLISKVHDEIKYSLEIFRPSTNIDSMWCINKENAKQAIENNTNLWLNILRKSKSKGVLQTIDNKEITNTLTYVESSNDLIKTTTSFKHGNNYDDYFHFIPEMMDRRRKVNYDFKVYFVCKPGTSLVQRYKFYSNIVLYNDYFAGENDKNLNNIFIGNCFKHESPRILGFKNSTLKHELGHIFGLGDTYKKGDGFRYRFESQPDSLMGGPSDDFTEDDVNGFLWLYRFYVKNEPGLNASKCPAGYASHKDPGTCITIEACNNMLNYEYNSQTNSCIEKKDCQYDSLFDIKKGKCVCDLKKGYYDNSLTMPNTSCITKSDCNNLPGMVAIETEGEGICVCDPSLGNGLNVSTFPHNCVTNQNCTKISHTTFIEHNYNEEVKLFYCICDQNQGYVLSKEQGKCVPMY